jgi:hypothetical protein
VTDRRSRSVVTVTDRDMLAACLRDEWCFSHGRIEPASDGDYQCFECKHRFPSPPAGLACPHCAHDF